MTGSVGTKVGRLVTHLLRQPQYAGPYLWTNLITHQTPLVLELPWISYAAIDFLSKFVKKDMWVFEYGSGGSTIFFARRTRHVVSVEDNPRWLERVRDRIERLSLSNVELQFRPFDFRDAAGFDSSAYLNSIPNQKFDVILIDGSEESEQVRPACFFHAEKFVAPGGVIVVDDSWRYPALRSKHHATNLRIFESVGPARPGVTSTDVFFY